MVSHSIYRLTLLF